MKILYLSGVDRKRDAVTVQQLSDLDDRLELIMVSSPPDAFEQVRANTEFAALITSAGVARSEILSLLVSLRRDKIDVGVFPVVSESQREFATAALAAGADDVMLQLGDTLINPGDALARVLEGRQVRRPAESRLLRVLYAGADQLVWKLLEQVPFVKPDRAASEALTAGIFHLGSGSGEARYDVVLLDSAPDVRQQAASVRSVRAAAAGMPVVALRPPNAPETDVSTLGLEGHNVIAKTGLYRRPLVAALERLHKALQPEVRTNHTQVEPALAASSEPTTSETDVAAGSPAPLALPDPPVEASRSGPVADTAELDRERALWQSERAALESRIAEAEREAERLPDLDETLGQVRAELEALRDQHQSERDEWSTIKHNTDAALEATRHELREVLERSEHDRQDIEATVTGLTDKVRSLEETHQVERARWEEATGTLESRLRAAATAAAKAEFEVALEANRAELRQAEDAHAGEQAAWETARREMGERLAALEQADTERARLAEELEGVTAGLREATSAREAERIAWSTEREQLRSTLAALERSGAEASSETQTALDAVRAELEATRRELAAAAEATEADRKSWTEDRQQLNDLLEKAQSTVAERDNAVASAHTELSQTRDTLDEARKELEAARTALQSAHETTGATQAGLDDARAAWDQERQQLESRVADAVRAADHSRDELQASLDSTRAELDGTRADRDGARADLDLARQELERHRLALTHEHEQVESRIADATRAAEHSRNELQAQFDAVRAELDTTRAERDGIRAELDGTRADRDATRADLDSARHDLERDRAALTRDREQIESRIADATRAADQDRNELQALLDTALAELDGTRAERDSARTELDGTRADRDAARAQLDTQRQEHEAARAELDGARAALDGVRRELDDVRANARRAADEQASEVERWAAERAAWDEERGRFDRRLDAAAQAAVSTERELQSTLDAMRTELETARHALMPLGTDLEAARDERQRAADEHAQMKATLEAERSAWTSERAALAKRAEDELAAARAVRRDLEAARTHLEEATQWHVSQEASWNTARQHLEAHTAALEAEHTTIREELEAKLRDADERSAELRRRADAHAAELQAARRRGSDEMQRFVQRGSFGYCTTTRDGRLLSCNDAFARILGYAGAEAALQSAGDQVFAPLANRDALDARLLGAAHAHGVETCLDRVDGRAIRVLESATSVTDPDTGHEAVERVFIDMNDYTTLEERLATAQRIGRVGTLAAEMAPDIEALLTSATEAATRLAPRLDTRDPRRAELDEMSESITRAEELLRQLLAFSRRQRQPAEPLDVNAVVADAAAMLARLVGPHIHFEFHPGTPEPVTVAEDDLQQLLTAMVVWARDLLPVGGTVRIDTALRAGSSDATGIHARHVVLGAHAIGYGVRTSQASEALALMTERCGGSISATCESGRSARLEIAFARCLPVGSSGSR